jgi:ADP-ribose pyrophosphatase YjhB (NUDIX family)
MAVRDDHDNLEGWRPLGGTIEFGERAAEALKREFLEELDKPIREPLPLAVLENLYSTERAATRSCLLSKQRSRTRRPTTVTNSPSPMPA